MKKIKTIILILILITGASCALREQPKNSVDGVKFKETSEETNNVKIEMKNGDIILLELYPDVAPITVTNFKKLVSEKFYDGTIFHRVWKDFMIQGGISATGKEADEIKGEFSKNGIKNDLKHERGVVSMARTDVMDSASSQFFIVHKTSSHLDGNYAGFGKVIAGMSTVDKIASVETTGESGNYKPLVDQVVKSIRFVEI